MSSDDGICDICGRTFTGLRCIRCTQASLHSLHFGDETLSPSVTPTTALVAVDLRGQPRLKAAAAGYCYPIAKPLCRVGHDQANDVALVDDDSVSRFHAQIAWQDGEFVIRDLGSKQGTWINGERLEGDYSLFPGDQVRIGSTSLFFVDD